MEGARPLLRHRRRRQAAKPGVAAFLANLETEVLRLERDFASGRYRPGRYTTIEVFDPKHRIVSAAPFRDRMVHHAFCVVCEPLFECGFIHDSYANPTGKGTHRAVARYEQFRERASRGGHDERRPDASPAPPRRGRGVGVCAWAGRPSAAAVGRT